MEESPKKRLNTSRVIDSLHSEIDDLKNELEQTRISADDYKKKYTLLVKKNDSIVDQLANAKHENDMINALLKRKERRIADLEDQYNELSSTNESLQLNNKNLKIRCENLTESSASSTAEYERLKIAYDALIASQHEYKKHYQNEVSNLASQLESYKQENSAKWNSISKQFVENDKDIDALLDSLVSKRKTMDNVYVNKNKVVLELLSKLASMAKVHGQQTKSILQENYDIIQALVEKTPDLQEKLSAQENFDIDLNELLSDSQDTLSNCSFDDAATLISAPETEDKLVNETQLSRSNTLQSKKRKNKRNSMRFDSKSGPDFSHINTPTTPMSLPKRPVKPQNQSRHSSGNRTPTPPTHDVENNYRKTSYSNNNYQGSYQHNYGNGGNMNGGSGFNTNNHSNGNTFGNSGNYNNFNPSNNYNMNNGNNFNTPVKFNNQPNSNRHQRVSSFNSTSTPNNQQSKQAKRRSYSNYNKRNSQIFDGNVNYAVNT